MEYVCLFSLLPHIVILIKSSLRIQSANQSKSHFKLRMMKRSICVAVINIISLSSLLVIEGLRKTGFTIGNEVLVSVTITLVALSKLCNPWLHSIHLVIREVAEKVITFH